MEHAQGGHKGKHRRVRIGVCDDFHTLNSDIDLLVVKHGVEHRRRLAQLIYRRLLGVEVPVDVLVVTPEDVEEFRDKAGTIIGPALREGREVYVA